MITDEHVAATDTTESRRFLTALAVVADITAIAGLLVNDGRIIVWTGSIGAVLLSAFIIWRRWKRDARNVPLLGMAVGVVGAVVAAGMVAYDVGESRAGARGDERVAELDDQSGQLRAQIDDLASELDDVREQASHEDRDSSEPSTSTTDPGATGDGPETTEPLAADVVYLVDLEPSRIEGDPCCDEGFARCGSGDRINGRSYPNQACWLVSDEEAFTTEWTLTDDFSRLRGLAGILDSCAQDTTYGLRILGNGKLLHSTTMAVGDVKELDVPISDDVLRLKIEIDGGTSSDHWCASIGDLRLE